MTHPKTGHDCATRKPPEWPLPNQEVTIRISRDLECMVDTFSSGVCNVGTKSCTLDHDKSNGDIWYAEVSGVIRTNGKDEPWNCTTHGETIVHAAEMAADLLRIHYEACKTPDAEHCYCRDITWGGVIGDHYVTRAKKCCLCDDQCRHDEFLP